MICELCIYRLEGIWDQDRTERLARLEDGRSKRRVATFARSESGLDDATGEVDSISLSPREDESNYIRYPNTDKEAENSSSDALIHSDDESDTGPGTNDKRGTGSVMSSRSSGISIQRSCSDSDERKNMEHPFHFEFGHHFDLASLLSSADKGCGICGPLLGLLRTMPDYEAPHTGYLTSFSFTLARWYSLGSTGMSYDVAFGRVGAHRHHDRSCEPPLHTVLLVNVKEDDPDLHVHLDDRTDSPKTWAKVQGWVSECMQSHTTCSEPLGFLPSRLLVLEDDHTFRLVDGAECPMNISYATLSYCWGPEPADTKFRLLQNNIDDMRKPQAVNCLPLTFQHAFAVIEKLKVRHLWIDRLCIIQDSEKEWLEQSSMMHHVFKNSVLTIAAHGADDDQGGLFYSRRPGDVTVGGCKGRFQSSTRYETLALRDEKYNKWSAEFESSASMNRGWIFQERLLSPRTVYYGRNQVFWECNMRRCCEGHPERAILSGDLSPKDIESPLPPIWRPPLHGAMRGLSEDPLQQLFMDWEGAVEEYSACHLTFQTDKLVALSGLASDLHDRLLAYPDSNNAYLAGIWMESLPTGLLWMTTGQPYKWYAAPSWSWASTYGTISWSNKWKYRFRGTKLALLAKAIDGKTASSGHKGTGQVHTGELVMQGHMLPIHVTSWGGPRLYQLNAPSGAAELFLSEPCVALGVDAIEAAFDDDIVSGGRLFCLPIQHNSDPKWGPPTVEGLLMRPFNDGTFARVGLFGIEVHDNWLQEDVLNKSSESREFRLV